MARYINKYANAAAIQDALAAEELSKPYVAYDIAEDKIDWNTKSPTPPAPVYDEMYLTFEILSDGTIKWERVGGASTNAKTIEYSKNGGAWTSITSATGSAAPTISVLTGDKICFRGNNKVYYQMSARNKFSSNCNYLVYGNILSLTYGDDFKNETTFSADCNYNSLFYSSTGLTDASNLILPQNVKSGCYMEMFYGCTSLTTAPVLPATTLVNECYKQMFASCSNLSYIKCLATDISANNCVNAWVQSVASRGTFVQKSGVTWPSGANGIPSYWTVEEE